MLPKFFAGFLRFRLCACLMAAGAVCLERLEGGERNGIGWNRNVAGFDLRDRGSALGIGFLRFGRRLGFLVFAIVLGGGGLLFLFPLGRRH